MSVQAYTDDQLVEQPAIRLFAELGWQMAGQLPLVGSLGRKAGHVVLVSNLGSVLG